MYVEGSGMIFALPVQSMDVAIDAGVGICYTDMQEVIVYDQTVVQVCKDKAAWRHTLSRLYHQVTYRVRQKENQSEKSDMWSETVESIRVHQIEEVKRLAQLRSLYDRSLPSVDELAPPLRDNLLDIETLETGHIVTESDFIDQADYLKGLWDTCVTVLKKLQPDGQWAGVFNIECIATNLEQLCVLLDNDQLFDAEEELRNVQRHLDLLKNQAQTRWEARQNALKRLVQANQVFLPVLETVDFRPSLQAEIEAIEQIYINAQRLFEQLEFATAEAESHSVILLVNLLNQSSNIRQSILEHWLQALQTEVEVHGAVQEVEKIKVLLGQARVYLDRYKLNKTESLLAQADAIADRLLGDVAKLHVPRGSIYL